MAIIIRKRTTNIVQVNSDKPQVISVKKNLKTLSLVIKISLKDIVEVNSVHEYGETIQ